MPEKHARKSLLSTSAGAVIRISATLDTFKLQSKTILTVPKQAHKLMSRGSGDTVGHGCDDLLAGSSTTKHDSPLSSSDAIKSCLDAFERGILVLCLQMCQSKSTLWLNGMYDVSYVVGIFLTLKSPDVSFTIGFCLTCIGIFFYSFFPPFFLCTFLSRCRKTEGERVNIFTHSPLPHTHTLAAATYDFVEFDILNKMTSLFSRVI